MHKFLQVLFQPYPLDVSWKANFKKATFGFAFVTFFLFIFKPFGIENSDTDAFSLFIICIYFGLITWAILMLFYLSQLALPHLFKEEGWKVWKEITATSMMISCLATANMLFSNYYFDQPSLWQFFWGWQKSTFSIGIFPTVLIAFYKQIKLTNQYNTESQVINQNLEIRNQSANEKEIIVNQIITIFGENQNEKLAIDKSQLCYISAADNYVQVFYLENDRLKQTLLRSSLKKIEENLAEFSEFYRCHRTYIVNLQKVKHISGNAQGYKLHLENIDTLIPVSRSLNEEMAAKFTKK
jgi:LytTr DNA-binding domain